MIDYSSFWKTALVEPVEVSWVFLAFALLQLAKVSIVLKQQKEEVIDNSL